MGQPNIKTRKEWRGAVIGMAMGDGSLYQNPYRDGSYRGNYKLDIIHCPKQLPYLEHKRSIVNGIFDYEIPIVKKIRHGKNRNKHLYYRIQTRTHPRLTFIAKRMYQDRIKRINQWVLDNITLEGLAYWYMDDGCLFFYKRPSGGGGIHWALNCFPFEDVQLFRDWLSDKYNIHMNINKHQKVGWSLRKGLSEGYKLCDLLRPYCAPSMEYKFNLDLNTFKKHPYNTSLYADNTYSACPQMSLFG